MRYINYIAAATLTLATANTTEAQTPLNASKAKHILRTLITGMAKGEVQNANGMDLATTKASQTSNFVYENNAWTYSATTNTEYNNKGYATTVITTTKDGKTKTENTYDSKLEGFITQTTEYTWDNSTATWTDPVVTMKVELERDESGRVTKETVYSYDEDTKELEKETEISFGYSLITKQLNSISTTVEEEDESGNTISMPIKITIPKWHKYNADKLFQFSMDDMGAGLISDTDNMIESATLSMTMENIPITGTISGKYTDTSSSITLTIPFMTQELMKMVSTMTITDSYGSNETSINVSAFGKEAMNMTIKNTNNEHGDCIKTETTGSGSLDDIIGSESNSLSDDTDQEIDLNQTLTYDYEYFDMADNKVLKKSMVTSKLDKTSNELVPTLKTTYDQYIDYVSGVTEIDKTYKITAKGKINAVYGINGTMVDNNAPATKKGVYIVRKADKTIKVMR